MVKLISIALNISVLPNFGAAYAENVPALLGKDQWNIVDPGFKLHSPVLTRPPGRPRKNMIRAGEEGRVKKQRKCKRCGILGHIARRCTNPVDASFGEDEQWEAANAEENAASLEDNAAAEENEASLENEATEVAAWYVCNLSIFLHLFSFLSMAKLISV